MFVLFSPLCYLFLFCILFCFSQFDLNEEKVGRLANRTRLGSGFYPVASLLVDRSEI
ncbi:hypothetical protein BDV28DRAFT_144291 [Aspergillus coremiiformis]|uniref:Uncharacterized protein n=1 Tax=Aspergillus coremiiformis TaxID=138285 RepID=A0A5N6YRT2_9EURO|nr:hypothetical protein BDV28DRAFT_144291 [Aspergillus coremiiformis]